MTIFNRGPQSLSDYIEAINRLIVTINTANNTTIAQMTLAHGTADMQDQLNRIVRSINSALGTTIAMVTGPQDVSSFLPLLNTISILSATSGVIPGAAASAALARLSTPITGATRTRYIRAINALDAGGWWTRMRVFHIYSSDTAANAVIDLTGNGFAATFNGTRPWLQNYGFMGDFTSAYVGTGFTPSTDGGSDFVLSSCSYGIAVANNRTINQAWAALSSYAGVGTVFDWIFPLFSDGKAYGDISNADAFGVANASGTKGFWSVSRTASNAIALYKDGSVVTTSAVTPPSALCTHPVILCAGYTGSGTAKNLYSGDTVSAFYAGAGFSAVDIAGINAAMQLLVPASPGDAFGFTNPVFDYTPQSLADVDTGLTNGPAFTWYLTEFWGSGNPSGSDFTYSSNTLISLSSSNAPYYRPRLNSRGNTSSVFLGSVSGTTLAVTAMIGIVPTHGGAAMNNPILVGPVGAGLPGFGQLLDGASVPGNTQPLNCPTILSQLSGTPGGVGTYQLSTNCGTIGSQVFNGYSHTGAIPLFSAGGYFEFTFASNPALTPASSDGLIAHTTLEMVGINSLFGRQFETVSNSSIMHSFELDFLEMVSTQIAGNPNYSMPVIEEQITAAYADWTVTVNGNVQPSTAEMGNPDFTSPTTIGVLWALAAQNTTGPFAGQGFFWRFINGIHVPYLDTAYTPGGVFSISETEKYVLQWEGGYGQPCTLYKTRVIQ